MKEWPVGNEMADMEDLLGSLKQILSKHANLKKDPSGDIEYTGYDIPSVRHNSYMPDVVFTKENRKHEAERGRNLYDLVLRTAFHLGLEQGVRLHGDERERLRKIADHWLDILEELTKKEGGKLVPIKYAIEESSDIRDRSCYITTRINAEGETKWIVEETGVCLNKSGEFEWEPSPSNRSDEFIARTRFDTVAEAYAAYKKLGEKDATG